MMKTVTLTSLLLGITALSSNLAIAKECPALQVISSNSQTTANGQLNSHQQGWHQQQQSITADTSKQVKTQQELAIDGCPILYSMPQANTEEAFMRVHFDFNSSQLNPEYFQQLQQLASSLKYNQNQIKLQGHTDSQGSNDYNQRLGLQRANAIANYLTSQGIKSERLLRRSYSEYQPISDNNAQQGQALNRRVDIYIMPL